MLCRWAGSWRRLKDYITFIFQVKNYSWTGKPEDGGKKSPQNIRNYSPNDTVSYPRTLLNFQNCCENLKSRKSRPWPHTSTTPEDVRWEIRYRAMHSSYRRSVEMRGSDVRPFGGWHWFTGNLAVGLSTARSGLIFNGHRSEKKISVWTS